MLNICGRGDVRDRTDTCFVGEDTALETPEEHHTHTSADKLLNAECVGEDGLDNCRNLSEVD